MATQGRGQTQSSKKARKAQRTKKVVEAGDRVRLHMGTHTMLATVVHDHGNIGVRGRRLLSVTTVREDGETERFDVRAEIVTLVRKYRAKT
jgi:hypothetical protein